MSETPKNTDEQNFNPEIASENNSILLALNEHVPQNVKRILADIDSKD